MRIKPINKFVKVIIGGIMGEVDGISLCPFGIYTNDKSKYVLNHEKIHWKQQIEMLILPFYIWYLTELFIRKITFKKNYNAYSNLSFEREAYTNQYDLDYLNKRKLYSWIKYLKKQKIKK